MRDPCRACATPRTMGAPAPPPAEAGRRASRGSGPAVLGPQHAGHPVEAGPVEHGALAADAVLVDLEHPVEAYPARALLAVPGAGAEGEPVAVAVTVALAADTLSIATMEIMDNLIMVVVPGALDAGLTDLLFWGSLVLALAVAFVITVPVNRVLIARGKGHAVVHQYHH